MERVQDTKEARPMMRSRLQALFSAKKCWILSGGIVLTVAVCIMLIILFKNKQDIPNTGYSGSELPTYMSQ